MLSNFSHKFDRLYLAFVPIQLGALIVAMLCGIIFIGLAIGSYFELIDLGRDFEDIGPLWIGLGGAMTTTGAYFGRGKVTRERAKVQARIKSRTTQKKAI